tara:strand:+ start:643 stop:906 length:264 start_codon:yes stop_codon:yes gene_type:complete
MNEKMKTFALIANLITAIGIIYQIYHIHNIKKLDQLSWVHILSHMIVIIMWGIFDYANNLKVASYSTFSLLILYGVIIYQKIHYNKL